MKRVFTLRSQIPASVVALVLSGYSADAESIEYYKVKADVIEQRLKRAVDKNPEREQILHTLFEEAGCKPEQLTEQPVKGSKTPNVICTLKGTEETPIVVGAHYDKVANGHGIIDNWSGAALLPSLFQGLNTMPRHLTFIFAGFTSEENGLVGSKYYVSQLNKEELAKIKAMVNLDSLGLSNTKVWLNQADKKLAAVAFGLARSLNLPLAVMNVDQVGFSDADSFRDKKIPCIDFHSLTQETFPILHSTRDTLSAIRLPEYENSYALLIAYLAYLDVTAGKQSPDQAN